MTVTKTLKELAADTADTAVVKKTRKPRTPKVVTVAPVSFASVLADRIAATGMTVNKFGLHAGLNPATIHNIVKGKINLSPEVALFVAPALGTTAIDLLREQLESVVAKAEANLTAEDRARIAFAQSLRK